MSLDSYQLQSNDHCEKVLFALRQIIHAIDQHSKVLAQKHGITAQQLTLLRELNHHGEMSVGELAKRMHLSQATVTGILDRLEHKALLRRERSESDKRRVLLRITPAGQEILLRAPSPIQDRLLSRFGQLEEWEQSLLVASIQRLAFMMVADPIPIPPVLCDDLTGQEPVGPV